jgi:hypothetical protein
MAQTTIQGSFLGTDLISAQTPLTTGLATTDELIVSDAGVIKRMDISVLEIAATQITASGTLPALNGAALTALTAANITASGTLPALNGAALTALTAANITASGTLPALNGAALTALNGTQVTSGTLPAARIAADSIVEAKLNVSNGPTNGQFLQAQDGVAGGLTWAAASGGAALTGSTNNTITTVTGANAIQGEANLTFDGANLALINTTNSATALIKAEAQGNTSSARMVLRVASTNTSDAYMSFHQSGGTEWQLGMDNSDSNKFKLGEGGTVDSNTVFTVATNGDMGLGTTNPIFRLHLEGGDGDYQLKLKMTHDSSDYGINMEGTGNNVGVTARFMSFKMNNNAGDEDKFVVQVNGSVLSRTDSYGGFSDERLKTNIVVPTSSLNELLKLKIKEFELLATPGETRRGIIAQEFIADGVNIPSFVGTLIDQHVNNTGQSEEVETYTAVYPRLIPWLIQAIQELKAEIDALS